MREILRSGMSIEKEKMKAWAEDSTVTEQWCFSSCSRRRRRRRRPLSTVSEPSCRHRIAYRSTYNRHGKEVFVSSDEWVFCEPFEVALHRLMGRRSKYGTLRHETCDEIDFNPRSARKNMLEHETWSSEHKIWTVREMDGIESCTDAFRWWLQIMRDVAFCLVLYLCWIMYCSHSVIFPETQLQKQWEYIKCWLWLA